jgi:hypothetical protein
MGEYPTDAVPGAASSAVGATDGSAVVVGLTQLAYQYLDQTRPWVRFMSFVALVLSGLMVLMGIAMLLVSLLGGFSTRQTGPSGVFGSAIGGGLLALFYIALAVLYVAPGVYLARYAAAIKLLKTNCEAGVLEDAIKHQRSFFRFVGIMMAIGLALTVVVLILAVALGVIAAAMAGRS